VQYFFIYFHTIVRILPCSVYFISCCALCIILHTWLKPRLQVPFCGPLFAIQTIWLGRAGCCRSDNSYINSCVSIPITSLEAFIMLYAAYICIIICASWQPRICVLFYRSAVSVVDIFYNAFPLDRIMNRPTQGAYRAAKLPNLYD
jgi:hypothetical protein